MNIFKRLFTKAIPTEKDILNGGVLLAMEFGKNWLKPIQERLKRKYKFLTAIELDNYNSLCQEAMEESHQFIYDALKQCSKTNTTIRSKQLKETHRKFLTTKYNWITENVVRKLYNQGLYYADKDGYYQFLK